MTLSRTLERLERFGDSDADRALRPPVTDPQSPPPGPGHGGSDGGPGGPGDPAARATRRHAWRRRLLVGAALVVVVAIAVTYLVGFSPLLGASTVEVTGTTTLSAGAVRTAAAIPAGSPLVRLDTTAVARRVEALPQVASAAVAVTYPSTVTVTVVERVPVLRLASPARLVDATGRVYLTVADDAPDLAGLPLTAVSGPDLTVAAVTAGAIPAAARALVGRIAVDPADTEGALPTVTLTLTDGRTVLWGDTGRAAEKGGVLGALFAPGAPPIAGRTIDVRDPDYVIAS